MALQVTGKNLDIGEALRSYVSDRIETAVDKYTGQTPSGHVRIEKAHGAFLTGCTIQLRSGLSLETRGEAQDAYASFDQSLERLEKRLRRYKRRLNKRRGPVERTPSDSDTEAPYYVIQSSEDEAAEPEGDNPVIVAETQTSIHELSVSDAVMQLDLTERPVLVFLNASHGRINVVYRRDDGNIGWIDPGGSLPQAN